MMQRLKLSIIALLIFSSLPVNGSWNEEGVKTFIVTNTSSIVIDVIGDGYRAIPSGFVGEFTRVYSGKSLPDYQCRQREINLLVCSDGIGQPMLYTISGPCKVIQKQEEEGFGFIECDDGA